MTGGEEVALSAEMGKELSGMIEDSAVSIWIGTTDTANDTLFISTDSNEPTIILGSLTPSTLTCKAGSSATATVSIRGRHLSSNVSVAVEGTNASLFSVSPVSFTIDADGKVTGTVTVTYSPTAGTAASTQHSATLKVTSGTVTQTLALSGTVAAGPSLTLTPSTLNLTTTSGSSASGTIHLEGSALDGDVALSITGNYVTFADGTTSKTVSKSDAANGVDIEVKFTATDDTTATLTATSTGATSKTASIVGTVVTPLAAGSVMTDNANKLKYTVLSDGTVSVKTTIAHPSGASGNLVIPETVNDADLSCVDENGNSVTGQGCDYTVTALAQNAFDQCSNLASLTLPATITSCTTPITNNGSSGPTRLILANGFSMDIPTDGFCGCILKEVILMTPCTSATVGNLPTLGISSSSTRGAFRQKENGGKYGNSISNFPTIDTDLYVVDQTTKDAIQASGSAGWKNFNSIKLISELTD